MMDVRPTKDHVKIFEAFKDEKVKVRWDDEGRSAYITLGVEPKYLYIIYHPNQKSGFIEFYTGKDNIRFDGQFNVNDASITDVLDKIVENTKSMSALDYL